MASRIRSSRESLTAERRVALRNRILRRLDVAPSPTLRERIGALLALVRPMPLLYRAGVAAILVVVATGGATFASADSLPDDPLYGVKLASEQVRLSLAQSPQDVAAVELTIAETRLREATELVAQQRDAEADVAVSAFGEHLANAAASLDRATPHDRALVRQIQQRVGQQQKLLTAQAGATPNAMTVLANATREIARVSPNPGSIADVAARAAEQAASLITVGDTPGANTANAPATPAGPQGAVRSAPPRPSFSAAPARAAHATGTLDPHARAKLEAAQKAAREAAERAREAAERAVDEDDDR